MKAVRDYAWLTVYGLTVGTTIGVLLQIFAYVLGL
jgi:hypothetical protein